MNLREFLEALRDGKTWIVQAKPHGIDRLQEMMSAGQLWMWDGYADLESRDYIQTTELFPLIRPGDKFLVVTNHRNGTASIDAGGICLSRTAFQHRLNCEYVFRPKNPIEFNTKGGPACWYSINRSTREQLKNVKIDHIVTGMITDFLCNHITLPSKDFLEINLPKEFIRLGPDTAPMIYADNGIVRIEINVTPDGLATGRFSVRDNRWTTFAVVTLGEDKQSEFNNLMADAKTLYEYYND